MMLLAVGSGPGRLVYVSRTCTCCNMLPGRDSFASVFEKLQYHRYNASIFLPKPGPGKGFNCQWFAVCKGRKLIEDHLGSVHHLLLLEFNSTLDEGASGRIMNDFEKACEHVGCEIFIKLDLFQQLPMVLASLCECDIGMAIDGMVFACRQYEATHTHRQSSHCFASSRIRWHAYFIGPGVINCIASSGGASRRHC